MTGSLALPLVDGRGGGWRVCLSTRPTLSSFLLLTQGADNSRPDYTALSCPTEQLSYKAAVASVASEEFTFYTFEGPPPSEMYESLTVTVTGVDMSNSEHLLFLGLHVRGKVFFYLFFFALKAPCVCDRRVHQFSDEGPMHQFPQTKNCIGRGKLCQILVNPRTGSKLSLNLSKITNMSPSRGSMV